MNEAPELSVVMFAYDEEQNLHTVVGELLAWLAVHEPEAELIVVDDGSHDRTAERARELLAGTRHRVVQHDRNRGIGAALKTGVRAARGTWVTFLPADGQIEPSAIGTLRAEQRLSGADVVFSVYSDRNDGLKRKLTSWGVRALIRGLHGVRMRSDGPYLFRRALFDPDALPPDSFFLNFEFPIRMLARGVPASEVTIRCRPRLAGQSKSASLRVIGIVGRELVELRLRRAREGRL
jgi:glycosyltransferase involved in cell wall biosynthesis